VSSSVADCCRRRTQHRTVRRISGHASMRLSNGCAPAQGAAAELRCRSDGIGGYLLSAPRSNTLHGVRPAVVSSNRRLYCTDGASPCP
jgi:hypothetical protein